MYIHLPYTRHLWSLKWSPCGKYIAYVSAGGCIHIMETKFFREFKVIKSDLQFIKHVEWSSDSKKLISSDSDLSIKIWDIEKEDYQFFVKYGQPGGNNHFAWSPDNKKIVVIGSAGLVIVYDLQTKAGLFKLNVKESSIEYVSWSPDGKKIALTTLSGLLSIYDLEIDKIFNVRNFGNWLSCVNWNKESNKVVYSSFYGQLFVYDTRTDLIDKIGLPIRNNVSNVQWDRVSGEIISCNVSNYIYLFNRDFSQVYLNVFNPHSSYVDNVLCWHPRSLKFAMACTRGINFIENGIHIYSIFRKGNFFGYILDGYLHNNKGKKIQLSKEGQYLVNCAEKTGFMEVLGDWLEENTDLTKYMNFCKL